MESNYFYIKISPEVLLNDTFIVPYDAGSLTKIPDNDECCTIVTATTTTEKFIGYTYTYSGMSQILTAGVSGTSLLTGLTVPILLTENTVDIGYYSVFDGFILQKETMMNFLFSGSSNLNDVYFYNTSDTEFKKYLNFSAYQIDWGDNTPITAVTSTAPNFYYHPYSSPGDYTITMSGLSPWGYNIIQKTVSVPFTGVTVPDPYGTAFFQPLGGSWSGTPISYDYIFTGDAICDVYLQASSAYTTVPIIVSGYTKSSLNDVASYGSQKFVQNVPITGSSGFYGVYKGVGPNNLYTAYTINDIEYYDYIDGTTVFVAKSSGMTPDMMSCSALTKSEVLLNVIDEAEVQSDVYIERGKNSGLESIIRLGEVDNIGDLEKYGYKFFNVINT